MRFVELVRATVFLAFVTVANSAEAGVSEISRSADGRDIIAHCRPRFHADFRTHGRTPPGNLSEDDYANMIRIFDYPDHFNSMAALEADVATFGPRVRNGEGLSGVLCASERRLQQLRNTLSTSREQARGATKPRLARPEAAAPAKKLPPARPAKMAPWSTKAMSTNPKQPLSPRYAAERADALASCSAPIQQYAVQKGTTVGEQNLIFEENWLNDTEDMNKSADEVRKYVAVVDGQIAAGNLAPSALAARRTGRCLYQRRLAQLEGSPLVAGAVDGTLTPLSIGGQTPPWTQQGKDARIIASDGESAMGCVKLVELAKSNSGVSGGGRVLSNQCSGPVEIVWCISPNECERKMGNMWTVSAGGSWPVSSNGEVRFAACHGANTAAFVKDTYGLRYYCTAPAKK